MPIDANHPIYNIGHSMNFEDVQLSNDVRAETRRLPLCCRHFGAVCADGPEISHSHMLLHEITALY